MGVAVTKDSDAKTGGLPAMGLAGASRTGTLLVVAGFLAVCHLIPWAWHEYVVPVLWPDPLAFSNPLLRAVVMGLAAAGAFVLLVRFVKDKAPGVRAGVFVGVALLALGLFFVWLAALIGRWLIGTPAVVQGLAIAVAVLWGLFVFTRFGKERFQRRLRSFEEQGWFTTDSYKKGQGRLTRRGTILGIMALVAAGLWVYTQRRALGLHVAQMPWGKYWSIALGGDLELPVLFAPEAVLPLLIGLGSIWFTYRLVSYPRFADFLIATESEMNKVSWSSRPRLMQDTIVVLTTLALLTVVLFLMDVIASSVLRLEWIRIIRIK